MVSNDEPTITSCEQPRAGTFHYTVVDGGQWEWGITVEDTYDEPRITVEMDEEALSQVGGAVSALVALVYVQSQHVKGRGFQP